MTTDQIVGAGGLVLVALAYIVGLLYMLRKADKDHKSIEDTIKRGEQAIKDNKGITFTYEEFMSFNAGDMTLEEVLKNQKKKNETI